MMIEISYTYKEEKGYTYFKAKSDDFMKAHVEAIKYFKKFVRENGLGKKATLNSIIKMTRAL